jgi:hypothetical protein
LGFLNGAPEEGGKVQKDGELWVETVLDENTAGPVPFVLVVHGCIGMSPLTSTWTHHVTRVQILLQKSGQAIRPLRLLVRIAA